MVMKRRLPLTVVLFAAVALFTLVSGLDIYCKQEFLQNCGDTNSTAGYTTCCTWIGREFSTDRSCLCDIIEAVNYNNSQALQLLEVCQIDTTGVGAVCPGTPPPSSTPILAAWNNTTSTTTTRYSTPSSTEPSTTTSTPPSPEIRIPDTLPPELPDTPPPEFPYTPPPEFPYTPPPEFLDIPPPPEFPDTPPPEFPYTPPPEFPYTPPPPEFPYTPPPEFPYTPPPPEFPYTPPPEFPPPEFPDTPPPEFPDTPPPTYDNPPSFTPISAPSPTKKSSKSTVSVPLVVGVTFGVSGLVLILLITFLFWRRWKTERVRSQTQNPENVLPQTQSKDEHQNQPDQNQHPIICRSPQSSLPNQDTNSVALEPQIRHKPSSDHSKNTFDYDELAKATNVFSKHNILGHGGFGFVYKGILPDGKEVAVKQLSSGSWQGEREFQAEVEIISRVHHRHLVSLVGYCVTQQTMLLVYEYVPNRTLEFHLHGKEEPTLDWPTRMRIASGSAKGLAYLHEDCRPKIIHRDVKAANILLDNEFEAQVADFGLAKLVIDNRTHVTTRVVGTFGYLAPEYAASGKLTAKSDVFSFGIVLLELITGRQPVDKTLLFENDSMVDWAMPLMLQALEDNGYETFVDKRLKGKYDLNEMKRMVACAVACIRHSVRHRPKMSQVARILEGDVSIEDLNQGLRPGHSKLYDGSSGSSSHYSSAGKYNVRKKNSRTAKEDHTSSEYSESTGEYNPFPTGSSNEV